MWEKAVVYSLLVSIYIHVREYSVFSGTILFSRVLLRAHNKSLLVNGNVLLLIYSGQIVLSSSVSF